MGGIFHVAAVAQLVEPSVVVRVVVGSSPIGRPSFPPLYVTLATFPSSCHPRATAKQLTRGSDGGTMLECQIPEHLLRKPRG